MNPATTAASAYEAPVLRVLGSVAELTLWCDKRDGGSDGFTYNMNPIVCRSS